MTAWDTGNWQTCLLTSLESIPMTKSTWISKDDQITENQKHNALQCSVQLYPNTIILKMENNALSREKKRKTMQNGMNKLFIVWNKISVFVNNIEIYTASDQQAHTVPTGWLASNHLVFNRIFKSVLDWSQKEQMICKRFPNKYKQIKFIMN